MSSLRIGDSLISINADEAETLRRALAAVREESFREGREEERRDVVAWLNSAHDEHADAARRYPHIMDLQLARADECQSRLMGIERGEHIGAAKEGK